jgi:hypothetical protein
LRRLLSIGALDGGRAIDHFILANIVHIPAAGWI